MIFSFGCFCSEKARRGMTPGDESAVGIIKSVYGSETSRKIRNQSCCNTYDDIKWRKPAPGRKAKVFQLENICKQTVPCISDYRFWKQQFQNVLKFFNLKLRHCTGRESKRRKRESILFVYVLIINFYWFHRQPASLEWSLESTQPNDSRFPSIFMLNCFR